jgi:hypothetical protein
MASSAAASVSPVYRLINLTAAQAEATGSGVTVAVLDTGTVAIPELAGKLTQGPDFLGGAAGDEQHGTAMAYVVSQVAPGARMLSARVMTGAGTFGTQNCAEAKGIGYAIARGVKVINLSLGNSSQFASGYESCQAKAVEQALAAGITVVASAGNDGGANNVLEPEGDNGTEAESFPAGYPGVIAVAAATSSGTRASFSTVHSYVDVSAPGVNIPVYGQSGDATTVDGTSPAAAVVSGIVALILSKVPGLAPWQVTKALESTASHPGSWNPETGFGEINAVAAIRAAERMTPASPTVSAVPYSGVPYFSATSSGGHASQGVGSPGRLVSGAVAGGLGLLLIAGGAFAGMRGRRGVVPAGMAGQAAWPGPPQMLPGPQMPQWQGQQWQQGPPPQFVQPRPAYPVQPGYPPRSAYQQQGNQQQWQQPSQPVQPGPPQPGETESRLHRYRVELLPNVEGSATPAAGSPLRRPGIRSSRAWNALRRLAAIKAR